MRRDIVGGLLAKPPAVAGGLLVIMLAATAPALADPAPPQPPAGPRVAANAPDVAKAPQPAVATQEIVVRARRLNTARNRIQPSLGASTTVLDQKALASVPQGANAGLAQVLLQVPGVAEDSYGQIHVRGDHNAVQYRLDGIELPEGLSVFSQALQSRFAHGLSFITGALPAQYGQLQAAVIDITTRSGSTDPGSQVAIYGGARDMFQPSASTGGSAGAWDYFVTADALHSRVGIENPADGFNAVHDLTNQYHGLGHIDYIPDADTRISLLGGVSSAQFQIPDNPGQVPQLGLSVDGVTSLNSSTLTEHQRELTDFAILSLQKQFGDASVQTAIFSRYASLYFTPDPLGDLLFTGIAQRAARSVWSSGTQTDASWPINDTHTIRAGLQATEEHTVYDTLSQVLPLGTDGNQTSQTPLQILSGGGRAGSVGGLYLQDEWKLARGLTLNYGGRFDWVDEYTHENQFSPRVNLVWQPTRQTTLHVGYAHYFTPPPFELVSGANLAQFANTTAASTVLQDTTVRAEHDNYVDAGIDQGLLPGWRAGIDTYFKQARDLIDEGQFGAPIILSAFNYRTGQVAGVELSTSYDRGPWSLYANLADSRAIGKDIVTGQFNFGPDELDYISRHYIHLDHDEHYAGSGGAAYTALASSDHPARLSADLVVGSGLRADGAVPNGRALPGYAVLNLAVVETLKSAWLRGTEFRLDVLNALDRIYEIRDGTGGGGGRAAVWVAADYFGGDCAAV